MDAQTHTHAQADGLCSAGQQTALKCKKFKLPEGILLDGLQLCVRPFRLENLKFRGVNQHKIGPLIKCQNAFLFNVKIDRNPK